jgi:glycogen operon protein
MASSDKNWFGAKFDAIDATVNFHIYSRNADRIELSFFSAARGSETWRTSLRRSDGNVWATSLSIEELKERGLKAPFYYGYRAWGPNWQYDPQWVPGSTAGFRADVDQAGNRFNPNKLLIDPYTPELSHDPSPALTWLDPNAYSDEFYGGDNRATDTGIIAPKSMAVLPGAAASFGIKPQRPLKDDVIYEVHLRGFTVGDPEVPAKERGTYKGAARKARYLKELGVTAVEFLPVHEFADEQNDDGDPRGDNYWGYMTLAFFAPNRRYAADKTAGGPSREFREMVAAFHAEGIKVFLDVVYNHTGEGMLKRLVDTGNPKTRREIEEAIRNGNRSRSDDNLQDDRAACLLSLAGIDNASYYRLRADNRRYVSEGGCGGNLNYEAPIVQQLIVDSLKYWAGEMGVDGFRFDLAPVLGMVARNGGLDFDGNCALYRAITDELPARGASSGTGVDLIVEPWVPGDHLGGFPNAWAEWNRFFRDVVKRAENKYYRGGDCIPINQIAAAIAGSESSLRKKPWNAINYVVSHDDCNAIRNIVSHDRFFHLTEAKVVTDQISWDHCGDVESQRKAVRNAFTLLMVSAGVPMFVGGDELFRDIPSYDDSQGLGRMNLVVDDNVLSHLDWSSLEDKGSDGKYLHTFVSRLAAFRAAHPCLQRAEYYTGQHSAISGLKDIAWYTREAREIDGSGWDDTDFLAFRIDAAPNRVGEQDGVVSIYAAYNISDEDLRLALPSNLHGKRFYRLLDTDNTDGWMTAENNFDGGTTLLESSYVLHERSILVAVEK